VRKVTEFTPDAKVRFELQLPYGDTYRAYRLQWAGRPSGKPAVALGGNLVYASWNGRSDIAMWEVLVGPDRDHLKATARESWTGLETAIPLPTKPAVVAVRALDASGKPLGVSDPLTS
jgi:hypothetical protein